MRYWQQRRQTRRQPLGAALIAYALLACAACGLAQSGDAPPERTLNFPSEVVLGPDASAPSFAYVANANFDLRYASGTVQVFDLARIEAALAGCADPCILDPQTDAELLPSEVQVDSYAGGLALAGDRGLYLMTRGDRLLTRLLFAEGGSALRCADDSAGTNCNGGAGAAIETGLSARNAGGVPADPVSFEVVREADRDLLAIAFRNGELSVMTQSRDLLEAPVLRDTLTGLGEFIEDVTFDATTQSFLLTSSRSVAISRIRWQPEVLDGVSDVPLVSDSPLVLVGVDTGRGSTEADFRQLVFDGPDTAVILARAPEALLDVTFETELAGGVAPTRAVELGFGPSRLQLTTLRGRALALVTAFDAPSLSVFDRARGRVLGSARQLSGPFGFAVDPVREWVLVADFRASSLRVIGLSELLDCLDGSASTGCQPRTLATVGIPRAVSELQ